MLEDKNLISYFEQDLLNIKKVIRINLSDNDTKVQYLMNNLAASEGKMLRAIFTLIGGGFGKIHKVNLLNISAAIEILHLATLIHDDIVDDANYRRSKETLHCSNGIKSALYMGDYLFSQAILMFSKNSSPRSITAVSETIKLICKSEINQFYSTYSFNLSIREYLKRINGKCASLFSLSLSIGAYEGRSDESIIKKLSKIGYYSGMAFQLIDDILDITSQKIILGKPSKNDLKEGIYTLPVIYEINKGNEALIKLLKNNNLDLAYEILKTSSGLEKTKLLAQKYTEKALNLIHELPNIEEKHELKSIIETLLARSF